MYDEVIRLAIQDIENLNLTYKVQKVQGAEPQNSAMSALNMSSQEESKDSQPHVQVQDPQEQSHQVSFPTSHGN